MRWKFSWGIHGDDGETHGVIHPCIKRISFVLYDGHEKLVGMGLYEGRRVGIVTNIEGIDGFCKWYPRKKLIDPSCK